MLFNSIEFAFFLPVVFALHWLLNNHLKWQNLFLVASSYAFYGWWDWRFLGLIALSSATDHLIGLSMHSTLNRMLRKRLLYLSLIVNLGLLGVLKYFNFFSQSFSEAFTLFGHGFDPIQLQVVLPVGISFYTFQTLSYTIDVYNRRLTPTRDPITFFAYVSFFPQLVAGPIERATNLIPQFKKSRNFRYDLAVVGLRQVLWGLFKKVVVADNCAFYANAIFADPEAQQASTLVLGAILFTFQIYGDFSGYSDIAIGTARLFGFSLMQNFAFPYFSRDMAEFWRRWHISLSTWFRDYLYIPLGGSRGGTWMRVRNTFVIFIISGFWHGANWTFIIWGALNAIYFLPLLLAKKNRSHLGTVAEGRLLPNFREVLSMLATFALTVVAWVFFRADNLGHATIYLSGMFGDGLFAVPDILPRRVFGLILLLVSVEWLGRMDRFALEANPDQLPRAVRWAGYYVLIALIVFFGGPQQEFIYFQF